MATFALLYNLDRCIGCRTCMVVCRQEGNEIIRMPIHTVAKSSPGASEGLMWHFPVPMAEHRTSKECARRVGEGLKPRCALNCPAQAIEFGRIEQLAQYIEEKRIPHAYLSPF